MSSGFRDIYVNPQERAASSDINRLQRFKERDLAELLRYMLNVTGDEDSGAIVEYSTIGDPLRAEIVNGLMVRPQLGSFDLLVDPGVCLLLQPDAAADESDYKFCKDAGVTVLGSLSVGSNSSGSTRVDVVECRLSATPGVVTDTRDVFDTSLGAFSATLVTKERYGVLEYRVRAGTPGAGFPGTASGWLPLCVASVPNGAASNDDATFWDVRPLVSDRVSTPFSMSRATCLYEQNLLALNDRDNGGELRASGTAKVSLADRWVGGILRRGSPGADADYVDLLDAANQADGYTVPATGFSYLYLATPFGLPRWARYNGAPATRVPSAPRGIPVLSTEAPSIGGTNDASFDLPLALGFGSGPVAAGQAACIAAVYSTSSTLRGGIVDGRVQWMSRGLSPTAGVINGIPISADVGFDRDTSTFTLIPGTHYPANAKALYACGKLFYNIQNNKFNRMQSGEVEVRTPAGNPLCFLPCNRSSLWNAAGGVVTGTHETGMIRVPLYPEYPGSSVPSTKKVVWHYDAVDTTLTITGTPDFTIYGWEF